MISKAEITQIASEIYKKVLKEKSTPTGYVLGGEYLVYKENNNLKYAGTNSSEAQVAMEGDNVVCLIAYYNTPNIKSECKLEDIERKITESLK